MAGFYLTRKFGGGQNNGPPWRPKGVEVGMGGGCAPSRKKALGAKA